MSKTLAKLLAGPKPCDTSHAMEVVVLAGGLGSRLKSVVEDLPKPMAPVGDRPFLAYLLDYWITLGARHFVLSVGYKRDAVQNYFGDFYGDVPVSYAIEEHPLGTGGGLLLASQKLTSPEDFVVLNGDTMVSVPARAMLEYHRLKDAALTVATREERDTSRYGNVHCTPQGQVTAFGEKGKDGGPGLINAGVYIFSGRAVKAVINHASTQALSLERDVFSTLIKEDYPIYSYKTEGPFLDIGIPEDYKRCAEFMKAFKEHLSCLLH